MESKINKAHYYGRRADVYLRSKKFEQSRRLHSQAIDLIQEVLKESPCKLVTESLLLQIEDHKRQINVIRLKERQHTLVESRINFILQNRIKNMNPVEDCMNDSYDIILKDFQSLSNQIDSLQDLINSSSAADIFSDLNNCPSKHMDVSVFLKDIHTSVHSIKSAQEKFKTCFSDFVRDYKQFTMENKLSKEKVDSHRFSESHNSSQLDQIKLPHHLFSPFENLPPIPSLEEPNFDLPPLQMLENFDS